MTPKDFFAQQGRSFYKIAVTCNLDVPFQYGVQKVLQDYGGASLMEDAYLGDPYIVFRVTVVGGDDVQVLVYTEVGQSGSNHRKWVVVSFANEGEGVLSLKQALVRFVHLKTAAAEDSKT